jgi:streptogramin lyase
MLTTAIRLGIRRRGSWRLVSGLLVLAVLAANAGPASASSLTEFRVPACSNVVSQRGLVGITGGPDGNVWYTDDAVHSITGGGSTACFSAPSSSGIAAGPDGNLWFRDDGANKIGRLTPNGTVTEFAIPTSSAYVNTTPRPSDIVAGPDGKVWFTELGANQIGTITTTGAFTEFPLPTAGAHPSGITAGPDGNLWFTEIDANQIGRITPTGTISEFSVPSANSGLGAIAAGADGNVWFIETNANKIGRITPNGTITEFAVPTANSGLAAITSGPDGNVWFTELSANRVGRITPTGAIAESLVTAPRGIATGPDGNLWITEGTAKNDQAFPGYAVERMAPAPIPVSTASPTISGSSLQGQMLNEIHGTWTNSPSSYTYQWDRCSVLSGSCTTIPGATSQSYVLTGADVGHGVRVEETPRTIGGGYGDPAMSAMSAAVQPNPPATTPPPSILHPDTGTVTSGRVTVHGNTAAVTVSCHGDARATCPITAALAVSETVKGGKVIAISASKPSRSRSKRQRVRLGYSTMTLAGNRTKTAYVTLNPAGRRLLARYHILRATLTLVEATAPGKTATIATRLVTFKARPGKRHN